MNSPFYSYLPRLARIMCLFTKTMSFLLKSLLAIYNIAQLAAVFNR